jgi:hypothetical protein
VRPMRSITDGISLSRSRGLPYEVPGEDRDLLEVGRVETLETLVPRWLWNSEGAALRARARRERARERAAAFARRRRARS